MKVPPENQTAATTKKRTTRCPLRTEPSPQFLHQRPGKFRRTGKKCTRMPHALDEIVPLRERGANLNPASLGRGITNDAARHVQEHHLARGRAGAKHFFINSTCFFK